MASGNRTVDEWERHVGAQIRDLRLERNLSQDALALHASVSIGTVRNLEAGRGSSLATLVRVLRILDRVELLDHLAPPASRSPMQVLREREARTTPRRQRASAQRAR